MYKNRMNGVIRRRKSSEVPCAWPHAWIRELTKRLWTSELFLLENLATFWRFHAGDFDKRGVQPIWFNVKISLISSDADQDYIQMRYQEMVQETNQKWKDSALITL